MLYILLIVIAIFYSCSPEEKTVDHRALLSQAITDTKNLIKNSSIGNREGQYTVKALTELNASLKMAEHTFKSDYATDNELSESRDKLYDACMTFETRFRTYLPYKLVDSLATEGALYLFHNLKNQAGKGILFGAHDPTGYGVGWRNDNDRSDVKDVVGSYPAVFSWDYLSYFRNPDKEADFVYRLKLGYKNNAITTICWHQQDPHNKSFYMKNIDYNVVQDLLPGGDFHAFYKEKLKKIAYFAKSIRTDKGNSIPVIFRPYHEHNGDWFWWGKGNCTEEQFKDIWRFTITYLRDSLNVHNFLYSFSPDAGQFDDKQTYLWNYPGDDYVDILGMDYYFKDDDESEKTEFQERLKNVVENAIDKNKIAALTETGNEKIEINNFFTEYLLQPIKSDDIARNIVYAVVWRNDNPEHHYAPYPGHSSVSDFKDFYNDNFTVFAKDMKNFHELK